MDMSALAHNPRNTQSPHLCDLWGIPTTHPQPPKGGCLWGVFVGLGNMQTLRIGSFAHRGKRVIEDAKLRLAVELSKPSFSFTATDFCRLETAEKPRQRLSGNSSSTSKE
jgi:hypothetical protein